MIHCLIPRELAPALESLLGAHFSGTGLARVIVERRRGERRGAEDRRSAASGPAEPDRRRVRNAAGRRVGDRRAVAMRLPSGALSLPPAARPHAGRIVLVDRLESPVGECERIAAARLVAAHQAGDPDAFQRLHERYFKRVFAYAKLGLGDAHEAEDVAQEVWLRVLRALPGYEIDARPFGAWLFRIARNYTISHRAKLRWSGVEDPERIDRWRERETERLDVEVLSHLSDRELLTFIERMPLPQRQVIMLRYMMGMSFREIAEVLDRSPTAVRMLQTRAFAFLRQRFRALGKEPRRSEMHQARQAFRRRPCNASVVRARRFALLALRAWSLGIPRPCGSREPRYRGYRPWVLKISSNRSVPRSLPSLPRAGCATYASSDRLLEGRPPRAATSTFSFRWRTAARCST